MAGAGGGYKKGLEVMLNDTTFDMVVGVVGTSSQFAPELGVKPIVEVGESTQKPLVAFCNPNAEEALRLFEENGIPSFRTPEACGRGLGYLADYGKYLNRRKGISSESKGRIRMTPDRESVRRRLDVPEETINEFESKRILSDYGLRITREKVCRDPVEAKKFAGELGYPVVLKVLSSDIPHKTETGAIRLGITSDRDLEDAYREMLHTIERYHAGARIDGILVQEMISGGVEVILGMYRDDTFGPVLMFGLGGVFVEVFQDASHRILPISESDARDMIEDTKGAGLLKGYRGKAVMDMDALVGGIMNFAGFCEDFRTMITEVDINPFVVLPEGAGAIVVDALIRKE
jgi:acetyltransferase